MPYLLGQRSPSQIVFELSVTMAEVLNRVARWTEQFQIGSSIVMPIPIFVVKLQYLWLRRVVAVLTRPLALVQYDGFRHVGICIALFLRPGSQRAGARTETLNMPTFARGCMRLVTPRADYWWNDTCPAEATCLTAKSTVGKRTATNEFAIAPFTHLFNSRNGESFWHMRLLCR
jgi:hypothetical protein